MRPLILENKTGFETSLPFEIYDINGNKIDFPDIELPYPDLSRFPIYRQ